MNTLRRLIIAGALAALGCDAASSDAAWTEAFDAEPRGWFLNAWGPDADTVFAVGGAPERGLVMRFDGEAWSPMSLGVEVPLLNWAFGFGASDVTVVGNAGTVLHYDGDRWRQQTTPTEEDLWGVWGAAPDDLWAVGGRGRAVGQATLLHYDGDAWSNVELPPIERANVFAFFKVFGTSRNNVYVVGQRGVVLRYDGEQWQELFVGASDDLIAVWATGPDDVVAVGGRATGIVSHWDGAVWRTESLAPLPGLNGVWMREPGVAHVVGAVGTLLTLELDGFSVTEELAPTALDFHAVFSPDRGRLYAVGGNLFATEGPYRGIAFERPLRAGE